MSDDSLICPLCNARQPVRPGLVAGQRLACVRCGETFVARTTPAAVPPADQPPPAPVVAPAKPIAANRRLALLVLAGMAVMAAFGLTLALWTVADRRNNDRGITRLFRRWTDYFRTIPPAEEEAPPPALRTSPGYLPERTALLVVLRVEALLAGAAGQDARSRTWRLGTTEFSLDRLPEWTGLTVDELDHLLLGVVVHEGDEPELTPPVHLVVRTRSPYDAARVRAALKAGKPREEPAPGGGRRTVYTASVRGLPLALWLADERTLVLGLFSRLETVPAQPREQLDHLPEEVRTLVEQRLDAESPAWAVGHARDWKKTWLPALLGSMKEVPGLTRLGDVTSFALWLPSERPVRLKAAFRCKDEAAARRLTDEELAPRRKQQPDRLQFSREGPWVHLQLTPEAAR